MIRTQVLKHLQEQDGTREKRESKENVRGGATAREAMGKSRYFGIIEEEEMRGDDPIECFFPPQRSEALFESYRGDGN